MIKKRFVIYSICIILCVILWNVGNRIYVNPCINEQIDKEGNHSKAYSTYYAEPMWFSDTQINSFLMAVGDEIITLTDSCGKNMAMIRGECKSGKSILWGHSLQNSPLSVFEYYSPEAARKYYQYPIYADEESFLTNPDQFIGWIFQEKKEFSFATQSEAEENTKMILAELGLTNLQTLRTLYIDHTKISEAVEYMDSSESFKSIKETQSDVMSPLICSTEDDAYFFSFSQIVDGIPISNYCASSSTQTYAPCRIFVWYDHTGIVYLQIETPWQTSDKTHIQSCITEDQALCLAEETLRKVLTFEDLCIDSAHAEYLYVQQKEQWILKPVWNVQYSYIGPWGSRINKSIIYDMYTGEEI